MIAGRDVFYAPGLTDQLLKTGDHDQYYRAWPEGGMLHRAQKMDAALREALIARVQHCARDASAPLSAPVCGELIERRIVPKKDLSRTVDFALIARLHGENPTDRDTRIIM